MSVEQDESVGNWIVVRAASTFEDDESALEALVQLKELDFDDVFTDRDTNLDQEDEGGISIQYSHENKINYLFLTTNPESDLIVSLTLSESDANQASKVLNSILRVVDSFISHEITVHTAIDRPFSSLDLPIEEDPTMEVVGIRVNPGDREYILQEGDEDNLHVTMLKEIETEMEGAFSDDFVVVDIERLRDFVEVEL